MSANGIWKVEMLGPYGWESIATSFFEDGTYRSASENHYSIGTYEVSGNRIKVSAVGRQHGKIRTLFGKKKKKMDLIYEAYIEGDNMTGQARESHESQAISFRATRLADLP